MPARRAGACGFPSAGVFDIGIGLGDHWTDQAAPEPPGRETKTMRLTLTSLFLCGGLTTLAWAGPTLPTGPAVVAGSATVTNGGSRVDIVQTTDRAIINWTAFSIGAGGTVQFVQPSPAAAALNRVTGGEASLISGLLTANGQVFLVNPNGITVGAGGRIDAAGLTLSTANIADGDFMAGNLRFEPEPVGGGIMIEAGASITAPSMTLNAATICGFCGSVPPGPSVPILLPPGHLLTGGGSVLVVGNNGYLTLGGGSNVPPYGPTMGGRVVAGSGDAPRAVNAGSAAPPARAVTLGPAPAPAPATGNAPPSGRQTPPPAGSAGDAGLAAGSVTIRFPLVGAGNIVLN
ncbi:MAG: filamentous hemagglutinin N-terminal domain-containing protein [Rhodocyclaceae bacterium]|nr:filamentous hemagglutinin N-terminal domain-containing protein [Rhodocyclaceae bacterium]